MAALIAAAIFGRRIPQVEGMPRRGRLGGCVLPAAGGRPRLLALDATSSARLGLPEKLVAAVRRHVPTGDVVFSDPLTAYELAAFAPVYINAAPRRTSPTRVPTGRRRGARTLGASSATRGRCRSRDATARTGCWSTDARVGRVSLPPAACTRGRGTFSTGSRRSDESPARHHVLPARRRGGVQRPLKLATHLPALGIETHVLAPDDPKWLHRDDELPAADAGVRPPRATSGRRRGSRPKSCATLDGLDLALAKARLCRTAACCSRTRASPGRRPRSRPPCASSSSEGIDAVITTSPPLSMNLIGAAVKRLTGVPWVADQRDSLVQNADRRFERKTVQAKEKALERVVRLVANRADGIVAVSDAIADEMRAFDPAGPVRVIPNGQRLRRLRRARVPPGRPLPDHAHGQLLRQAQPTRVPIRARFLGLDDVVARFVGDFRSVDREWVEELDLGDRLELLDYLPHRRALELQRDSEANLLLLPEAARRGKRRPERQDLRVPRGRAADPRRGADRRRRRAARA